MVWMVALIGCMGGFSTWNGAEPVRGAFYLDVPEPRELGLEVDGVSVLVLTNSTLPCRAEVVEDDPNTAIREDDSAATYWRAQLAAAFSREGALSVGFALLVADGADRTGEYEIDDDVITEYVEQLDQEDRVAAASWALVEEAAAGDPNGVLLTSEVEEVRSAERVDSPATLTLEEMDDELVVGRFDFSPTDLSGHFRAEVCDNPELSTLMLQYLTELGGIANIATLALASAD